MSGTSDVENDSSTGIAPPPPLKYGPRSILEGPRGQYPGAYPRWRMAPFAIGRIVSPFRLSPPGPRAGLIGFIHPEVPSVNASIAPAPQIASQPEPSAAVAKFLKRAPRLFID